MVIAANEDWFVEGTGWVFESNESQLDPLQFEMWFTKVLDMFANGVILIRKDSYNTR